MDGIFDILILNGRPAAGKSEIIDYLQKLGEPERRERFHVGRMEEFDDFPILWERFEDDDLFEENGRPRVHSERRFEYEGKTYEGYVFKDKFFWNFLLRKLSFMYAKRLRDDPDYHRRTTAIFEFARGSEHGGWKEAYPNLSDTVLERANTIYIDVDWEESLRKNRRRYNPDRPDSILQHALEDKKMEMLYRESDWDEFHAGDAEYLSVRGFRVPYAVFRNMPEITDQPEKLGAHLEEVANALWDRRRRLEDAEGGRSA
jgi:hypothetical protein